MPTLLLLLAGLGYQFPFTHINACRGYGDWNGFAEFHSGLDFRCDSTELAFNPYWDSQTPVYVLKSFGPDPLGGWVVFMVPDLDDETGWAYEHMLEEDSAQYAIGTMLLDSVGRCQAHPLGRHLHMCWMDVVNWHTPLPGYVMPQPGYFNPFDSLPVPSGYDVALFDTVQTFLIETPPPPPDTTPYLSARGIWFVRDGIEDPIAFPGYPESLKQFQDHVWGRVDAIVKAISAYEGLAVNDSCGVRELSHRLMRIDKYTGAVRGVNYYDWRTLFDMTGFIPDDGDTSSITPEYEAVFSNHCFGSGTHFDNNYILTNCGCDPVEDDSCLTNVWTSAYSASDDFTAWQFCRGAWDTRLWNPYLGPPPPECDYMAWDNSQALFPDGRYAFEVTATSQGSHNEATAFLPTSDLADPGPRNVLGVVVDNFQPYVDSVVVYTTPDFEILYTGGWHEESVESGMVRRLSATGPAYPLVLQSTIAMAVRYSEPMQEPLPDDVRLMVVCGSDTLWNSGRWKSTWLEPCDWDLQLGNALPDSLGFWQCYRMHSVGTPPNFPSGYDGRFQLSIGHPSPGRADGPIDLADNPLDSDPATIAVRDPETGEWQSESRESGPDDSHGWAIAHSYSWLKYEHEIRGSVCDETVDVGVDGELSVASIVGDCNWICGFWMSGQSMDEDYIRAYPVRPDGYGPGLYEAIPIPTRFEDIDTQIPDPGHSSSSMHKPVITGEYLWVPVQNVTRFPEPPPPDVAGSGSGDMVCVHCEDGVVMNAEVFTGAWFAAPVGVYWGPSFTSVSPCDTLESAVEVSYIITGEYPYYTKYTEIMYAPGAGCSMATPAIRTERVSEQLVSTSPSLALAENPCTGSVEYWLALPTNEPAAVTLLDLAGRVVKEAVIPRESLGGLHSLDASDLPAGAYVLRASSGDTVVRQSVVILN
jgi:hypothetical protein